MGVRSEAEGMLLSVMTLSVMTLSAMTLSVMTLSVMTLFMSDDLSHHWGGGEE
jgi:hypothetical protein